MKVQRSDDEFQELVRAAVARRVDDRPVHLLAEAATLPLVAKIFALDGGRGATRRETDPVSPTTLASKVGPQGPQGRRVAERWPA